jgi:membrane-associated phospholipid phosphatase
MSNSFIQSISLRKLFLLSGGWMAICGSVSVFLIATEINQSWMLAIHSSPVLPTWFWSLVNLGGDAWVVLLILLLIEKRQGEVTSWVLKTWLMGAFLVQLIKYFFPQPRPVNVLGISQLSIIDHPPMVSGSMPSGHALAAVSCGFIVCMLLRSRGVQLWSLTLISLLAVLAAWARVAVGAHWPADVIAGAGLAFGVVVMAHVWEMRFSWNSWFLKRQGITLLIVLHILIALHLTVPQSEIWFVQFVQFTLAFASLLKATWFIKENFWFRPQ